MKYYLLAFCALLLTWSGLLPADESMKKDVEESTLRSSIKIKGYPCSKVTAMKRGKEYAHGRIPWLVTCPEGSYSVTYMGDAGAVVKQIKF